MAKSTTGKSPIFASFDLADDFTQEMLPEPRNLTEVLRRALIGRPGEAGALGVTWITRGAAERQAAQFCQARPMDCVASALGDYHARVYELADDGWGVVVWYAFPPEMAK
jgi:hypothetical protein